MTITDPSSTVLEVRDLTVRSRTASGPTDVLREVSLQVGRSDIIGVVGESGSGKSTFCRAISRTLPDGLAVGNGSVLLNGTDLLTMRASSVYRIQPGGVRMVFQNPQASLNPVMTVGQQVSEALRSIAPISSAEARRRGAALLGEMGIADAQRRLDDYPHQFSGGQRQRIVIAIALAGEPSVLLADEPTSALDVTTQAAILSMFRRIATERGTAIIMVSHNYAVISELCNYTIVLYAGQTLETGVTDQLIGSSRHPYTAALIASVPSLRVRQHRLPTIPGEPPTAWVGSGCPFSPRCEHAQPSCLTSTLSLTPVGPQHSTACLRAGHLWPPTNSPDPQLLAEKATGVS